MTSAFIAGKDVYLRPLLQQDLDGEWCEWFNDDDVCRHNNHYRLPKSRRILEQYLEEVTQSTQCLVLAVVSRKLDKHVGNVSLQSIDWINRNAEFAIILGEKDVWGSGIGTESGHLIIRHGFEQLNLRRIHCGTSADNVGMQKLASALGMQEEGRRREAMFKNGEYVDIIEYGVLCSDLNE